MSGSLGVALTVVMLAVSNFFMLCAWYWHVGGGQDAGLSFRKIATVVLISWAIAFFEYCIAVPANRIGSAAGLKIGHLKIIQEVVTVAVFIPFLLFVKKEEWNWDYLWALLCMVGAVFFVYRKNLF